MTEQLGFQKLGWNIRAIHGDESTVGARARLVNCFGDQLFAGAALAGDQDRRAGRRHLLHQPENFLHDV